MISAYRIPRTYGLGENSPQSQYFYEKNIAFLLSVFIFGIILMLKTWGILIKCFIPANQRQPTCLPRRKSMAKLFFFKYWLKINIYYVLISINHHIKWDWIPTHLITHKISIFWYRNTFVLVSKRVSTNWLRSLDTIQEKNHTM